MKMLRSLIVNWILLQGVHGFVSPNTRSLPRSASMKLFVEGIIKTITREGTGAPLKRGDVATVKYTVYLPDSPPFARSESQRVVCSIYTNSSFPVSARELCQLDCLACSQSLIP
jgi:hypothetical protein